MLFGNLTEPTVRILKTTCDKIQKNFWQFNNNKRKMQSGPPANIY